jgi:hypothetical protein
MELMAAELLHEIVQAEAFIGLDLIEDTEKVPIVSDSSRVAGGAP